KLGKNSEKSPGFRDPPNQFAIATFFTPGIAAIRSRYDIGRLKTRLTACRVTRRDAFEVARLRFTARRKVCSVQNRKMQSASARMVLALRIQDFRRCLRTSGRKRISRPSGRPSRGAAARAPAPPRAGR